MSEGEKQTVRLTQRRDYQFEVDFGAGVPALLADEPAPLGQGAGPSPVQLLAAAVGNCLSDSLLFALRKFKQRPEPMSAEVTAEVGRNAEGRLRVLGITASLTLGAPADTIEHLDRVLGQFEAFCTVTQSVGQGIPVRVQVFDAHGLQLK
ncbi:OsmC family protein [Azohydromonas sp.]|uniref:OsmC family protein n=1 Tax=Azohydromonas sp. TaxID=1872666 RepID=UPI002D0F4EEC|nr:OsmC family protein [Azohydromonas sp.]HMM84696.1 OsmC family protein [Azohydromonas sp.]